MPTSHHHRSIARSRPRARPRARRSAAGRSSSTPAGARDLERAARELGALTEVVALPGDVADDWHRGALVAAAGDQIDLLVNNASVLGPSPQPSLAGYPLDELERVYEVNVLAPLALAQLALPRLRRRRRDRQRHLRRGGRAVRGVGRLRLLEGGARPAHRDPRRGAPRAARLRRRSGRHAHPDAPGGVPGRGHLRPAAARGERARAARADRRRPARAAATRRASSREVRRVSALAFELPTALEAREPPEARGLARDGVRLLVARAGTTGAIEHATLRRSARAARARRPARRQRVGDAARPRSPARRGRTARGARALLHPGAALDDGWRVVELRSADGARPRAAPGRASGSTLRGGARARAGARRTPPARG